MRLMMYILLLVLTAWASYFVYQNPGDIELIYKDWIIQMPLWLPVLGGVATLVLLTLIYNFLSAIMRGLVGIRNWITGSSKRAIEKNANSAWRALAEGDWATAETKMLKAAKSTDEPLHYYLAAAKAAQELGATDRRDSYLHLALRMSPDAKLAVGITQAELQMRAGQYEYSIATVQDLYKSAPHNKIVLRLAAQLYSLVNNWEELIKLMPVVKKHAALTQVEYAAIEVDAYRHLLQSEAKSSGKQALIACWETLPRDLRTQPDIVATYAKLLLALKGESEAEQVIRASIKKQYDSKLVKLYGLVLGPDIGKQITAAEGWLRTHPNDPVLLLTLARLCIAHKLWGKARSYLESSIALETNPDAYAELGRLLGFLGEQQKSLECYKKGLMEFASILDIDNSQK